MSSKPVKPVVFLTFANASNQEYLSQLKKESGLLRDLFLPLHQQGEIELLREESLNNTELPKLLNQYKGRISIFHYGGHADGNRLSLEDGESNVKGLAELLSLQTGLKLVFLNGCSTQGQARPYLDAGIPVVLATTKSIPDEEATFFADHFYHALLNGHNIQEAFRSASGALKTRSSKYGTSIDEIVSYRGLLSRNNKLEEMPWQLYVQQGKESALDWNLVIAPTGEQKRTAEGESKKKPLKQRAWNWILAVGVIVALLAGIAEVTGYSIRDFFQEGEHTEIPEKVKPTSPEVSTTGDNSPAIITDEGDVNINYGDPTSKKDSTHNSKTQQK